MKKKVQYMIVSLALILSTGFSMLPVAASAATFNNDACEGVNVVDNSTSTVCSNTSGQTLNNIIKVVLNILSILVGMTAVIMVIVGGFNYITSSGDSSKTTAARNTILYAVIGLVVVASAQVIVHFVLASANNALTPKKKKAAFITTPVLSREVNRSWTIA